MQQNSANFSKMPKDFLAECQSVANGFSLKCYRDCLSREIMSTSEYLRKRAASFRARAQAAKTVALRSQILSFADFCERMAAEFDAESSASARPAA